MCELLHVDACGVYVPAWLALGTQTAVSNPETDNVPGWIPQASVGIRLRSNGSLLPLCSVGHTTVNKTPPTTAPRLNLSQRTFCPSFFFFSKNCFARNILRNLVPAVMRQLGQQFALSIGRVYHLNFRKFFHNSSLPTRVCNYCGCRLKTAHRVRAGVGNWQGVYMCVCVQRGLFMHSRSTHACTCESLFHSL